MSAFTLGLFRTGQEWLKGSQSRQRGQHEPESWGRLGHNTVKGLQSRPENWNPEAGAWGGRVGRGANTVEAKPCLVLSQQRPGSCQKLLEQGRDRAGVFRKHLCDCSGRTFGSRQNKFRIIV